MILKYNKQNFIWFMMDLKPIQILNNKHIL